MQERSVSNSMVFIHNLHFATWFTAIITTFISSLFMSSSLYGRWGCFIVLFFTRETLQRHIFIPFWRTIKFFLFMIHITKMNITAQKVIRSDGDTNEIHMWTSNQICWASRGFIVLEVKVMLMEFYCGLTSKLSSQTTSISFIKVGDTVRIKADTAGTHLVSTKPQFKKIRCFKLFFCPDSRVIISEICVKFAKVTIENDLQCVFC